MSTISSPIAPITTTPTTTSNSTSTPIRLPSINELTSRSSASPRVSIAESAKLLPSISTAIASSTSSSSSSSSSIGSITSPCKYQPLKSINQSNYILHNSPPSTNNLPKITSPALPLPQQQQQQQQQQLPPASSISPVSRLINTPPQQSISTAASTPTSSSPSIHYQYYQYPQQQQQQQPQQQPQPQQQQYPPQPAYYHQQPIYYHGAPTPGAQGAIITIHNPQQQQSPSIYQQPTPEVINKPINKCHRCGTTETPEWRRGPKGVRTLCNACGLFHAKLVKRKGAALAAEEVLNNKVTKGKNGRRISIKKHLLNECLKNKTNNMVQHNTSNPIPPQYYVVPPPAPIPQQQQSSNQLPPPPHNQPIAIVGQPHHPQGITLPPPMHFNNNGMMIPPQPPHVIPIYQNAPVALIRQ